MTPLTTRFRSSRRRFLRLASSALAVPQIVPRAALGLGRATPPSDRIGIGLVGLGMQGTDNLRQFLALEGAQVVAVCDVEARHFREVEPGQGPALGREPAQEAVARHDARDKSGTPAAGCAAMVDFRELCARDDVDAVVVSTPDHWHALVTLEAIRQGKDVYCEKPLTHLFAEGLRVVAAAEAAGTVFQTGSQQRSIPVFRRAVEIVRNGHLGAIRRVEVGLPDGYPAPMGDPRETEPPPEANYDLWCGPAPRLPYCRARHHRWWRGHLAFGGGTLLDWIGHHNDVAHWGLGLDASGPEEVRAVGWQFPETPIYNTPVRFEIVSRYPGGVEVSIADRHELGTKFIGESGWLHVTRFKITASDPRWARPDFSPGSWRASGTVGHHQDFLHAVRERGPTAAPPAIALRSVTPGWLGYLAQELGRPIRWDAARQAVIDDPAAQARLTAVSYREPWRWEG